MNNLFIKALAFAAEKHRTQSRKDEDESPYINHPIALANVLANEAGITDINVLCAAVLHDTIEDTKTTKQELIDQFGPEIAGIVLEVSDDKSLPKDERKRLQIVHASHASYEAKLVKLADKICNLRDMLKSPPVGWSKERIVQYFVWAAAVVERIKGTNSILETIFDNTISQGIGPGEVVRFVSEDELRCLLEELEAEAKKG